MPRQILPLTVLIALTLHGFDAARADVVPAPRSCPSGQVWTRGHSGGCKLEAPDDCAPGWRGIIGGTCIVAVPDVGASPQCPDGEVPKAVTLCLEKRLDRGNGRIYYDPPREYDAPIGIVGGTALCEGGERRAAAGEVCIDPDLTPTPFVSPAAEIDGPRHAGGAGCGRGCAAGTMGGVTGALALALGVLLVRFRRGS